MTKLAAISYADLLLLNSELGDSDSITAELLGYECKPCLRTIPSAEPIPIPTAIANQSVNDDQELDEPELEYPSEQPRLRFLMATHAETLKTEPTEQFVGNPISDADLAIPRRKQGLPLQPLVPWSRLSPFLKHRLGTRISGSRLNVRKLVRIISMGQLITTLPRQQRHVWCPKSVILCDDSPELFPFRKDTRWLLERLKRDRGMYGLSFVTIKGIPDISDIASTSKDTVLFAISAMGQLEGDSVAQAAWLRIGGYLRSKGQSLQAIIPCPRNRWRPELARCWNAVSWDRGCKIPRHGGMSALPATEKTEPLHERLLDLLSPAALIEPPLLRAARLILGSPADVGTEWDAWNHPECWRSVGSIGFEPGPAYENRLRRRAIEDESRPELVEPLGEVIRKHHERSSRTIAAESILRDCLSGTHDPEALKTVRAILQSVVVRLRREAMTPCGEEGENSGLSAWFTEMVERLSPAMRKNESVDEQIAHGLALAHTWQRADSVIIPTGVNPEAYAEESRRAAMRIRDAGVPVDYIVGLEESGISVVPADQDAKPAMPIGRIRSAGQGRLQVEVGEPSPAHHSLQLGDDIRSEISFDSMPTKLRIESTHSRLEFEAAERPEWAERLWYDRFGIAAEFTIRDVKFVLRWIPPGRFLMGSPESEVGRSYNEGPQHEVTISQGYWLGETPVTQAQWAAVVEAGKERSELWKAIVRHNDLNPKPSGFADVDDSANHPVEQVSWNHCDTFCQLLDGLMSGDPKFGLPSEAQWEHACRAGTSSAFSDGSACTVPEGLDPALDQLGWFYRNSDGKTHPVQKKKPNAWGLYDMHGNVREWCVDAMEGSAYQSRDVDVVDPLNDSGKSLYRRVRGGAWDSRAQGCRAAFRYDAGPAHGWSNFGLRLFASQGPRSAEPTVPERRSRG